MIGTGTVQMFRLLYQHRNILFVTSKNELERRYSGTFFGSVWIVIYPLLFLSVYLFVYMVVFRVRFPGFSELDYVLYVFSGLVPYIAFMEAFQSGAQSVKQNLHLIKNVLLPIELIPARTVIVAITTSMAGLGLVFFLAALNGSLSVNLVMLPIAVFLQVMFLLGLAYLMAPLGLFFPDTNHFTGIVTLFLVFVSPIGFKPDMVPARASFIVDFNPIHYFMSPFRIAFGVGTQGQIGWNVVGIDILMTLGMVVLGMWFFKRFKNHLVDYE